ncbi:unnamed protein product [Rotaria sp. Silwood2]|nr:unnamed protein product [Rotaria sp. Silwood2]CAF4463086.1 unnamed protein product [Rotaria sp. Silwood2]
MPVIFSISKPPSRCYSITANLAQQRTTDPRLPTINENTTIVNRLVSAISWISSSPTRFLLFQSNNSISGVPSQII